MEEAVEETDKMLGVYEKFAREHLALPVFTGEKSESERFPGAVSTLCIEAMVQDRKAIQAGTSHFLGQNFSRAAGIEFAARDGSRQFAWTTSWGVSTRLIGTLIMAHSDDDGLVLPPRVAPSQIVILPVLAKEESRAAVLEAAEKLAAQLRAQTAFGEPVRVEIDRRDAGGGTKNWEWIKKGVPLRVEIGPRDIEKGSLAVSRRDRGVKDKEFPAVADFVAGAGALLEAIQSGLLERATKFRDEHTRKIDSADDFRAFFTPQNAGQPEIHGGFALTHWDGTRETEEKIKEELKVTIRCIPRDGTAEPGVDPFSGQPSASRVVFAKSY
jgi:prolyl-tRNA synthetase